MYVFRPSRIAAALFFLALLAFIPGCTLIQGPPTLEVPTPRPTAPLFVGQSNAPLVQDPVSNIVPAVDPSIAALLELPEGVSRQSLFAYVQTLEGFGSRHSLSDTQSSTQGIGAARSWLFNEFQRVGAGRLEVRYQDFPHSVNGVATTQSNIVATLPGTSGYPGLIVLGAHYDSRNVDPLDGSVRAPGANDNATGVAMLLEAARLLSSRSWSQTIVFVAYAAEEQQTAGARSYVQNALIFESAQIDLALNYDIVGGRFGIPQSIRAFALGPDTSINHQLIRYIDYVSAFYLPQFPITVIDAMDRPDRYGDQREFINAGIAAVRFTESEEDPSTQHTGQDTSEKLDYDYMVKVTQLTVVAAANMAGAPARPQPPLIVAMEEPGWYILNWAPDRTAAGYAISFRPVGSPDYAPFRYVRAAEAGNVVLTGFDPNTRYAVSMAALDANGRLGLFSQEVIIGPP